MRPAKDEPPATAPRCGALGTTSHKRACVGGDGDGEDAEPSGPPHGDPSIVGTSVVQQFNLWLQTSFSSSIAKLSAGAELLGSGLRWLGEGLLLFHCQQCVAEIYGSQDSLEPPHQAACWG